MNRYFDHLSPRTAMERTNLFIQTNPNLFWNAPEGDTCERAADVTLGEITVRRERQTFTRLPKSNAVLFTVRTYMTPLVELGDDELSALRGQIAGWEDEMKVYKAHHLWGEKLQQWCEEKLGARDPADVFKSQSGCPV